MDLKVNFLCLTYWYFWALYNNIIYFFKKIDFFLE